MDTDKIVFLLSLDTVVILLTIGICAGIIIEEISKRK